jgi:hypothetical protein
MSRRGPASHCRIPVMRLPRLSFVVTAIICFLLGTSVCAIGPRLLRALFFPSSEHQRERARGISPDGQFDAVMVLADYDGGIGGIDWRLYVVRRGKAVTAEFNPIFSANKLDHEKLVWKQAHLLEIQYDIAAIERFRNVWCSAEIENAGSYGERDYCIEIRLAPIATDFSVVTPEGGFRQSQ